MMLNPTIKLALNEWSKAKIDPEKPNTLRDFSEITFGMQTAILKKVFKKLLSELPTKDNPTDFLIIGACGFSGEEGTDNPFIIVGEMAKYKGFINKKIKEKNCARGSVYVENGQTICFFFEKGKIKNESKAKKILKPIKSLLNKFDIKLLFNEVLENQVAEGQNETDSSTTQIKSDTTQLSYAEKVQKISPAAEAILKDILAKAAEDNALITTTFRSVSDQTKVVVKNIVESGVAAVVQQYNGNGKILVKAFIDAKKEGKDTKGIMEAVANTIKIIGPANVSDHCNSSNPAIEIHPASIKNAANFTAILLADNRVSAVCPPEDLFYRIVFK